MTKKRILIVDDEANMQSVLSILLEDAGYKTLCAKDGLDALRLLESGERCDVIVSDLRMSNMDGLGLLKAIHERNWHIPFILISAYGTIATAVQAMKLGAVDVFSKPFTKELILNAVERFLQIEKLATENQILKINTKEEEIVHISPVMQELEMVVQKVAKTASPVLLTGESGTGKEVIARHIHRIFSLGRFDSRPFVLVNCPAVPEHLLESELFGYRKGAFTGADRDFKGKVELAHGGTLFFDEIGDLPLAIQPKLLRLLENRTYEPLGSGRTFNVDIRILCATNKNLKKLVNEGRFREDLLYRINTIHIEVPKLSERKEDICALAAIFLQRFTNELNKGTKTFATESLNQLLNYNWPGNIRELKNVIERAVVLASGNTICPKDLPKEFQLTPIMPCLHTEVVANTSFASQKAAFVALEKQRIVEALRLYKGNITKAARHLGMTRGALRYRVRQNSLSVDTQQDKF